VPYNLLKFFGYLGLSILLFVISVLVPIDTAFLRIVFHTLLLLVFAAVAWRIEKPGLAKVF
jgi:hypothetical protein